MKLPTWMRKAMMATAVMNIGAAALFLPAAGTVRGIAGFPEGEHPLYLITVSMFVFIFGLAYLWVAVSGSADRLFITMAATGKLSFFTLLVYLWASGALPVRAAVVGVGDLVFGALFVRWLWDPASELRAVTARARA